MYKIALCDDDVRILNILVKLTNNYFANKKMQCNIDSFNSGLELINSKVDYNLVFLDIKMDEISGIDVAKRLRERGKFKIKIIFITSYSEHMKCALDLRAFGYIVKPINQSELLKCLEDFIQYNESAEQKHKNNYIFNAENRKVLICIDDIYYFEKYGKKIKVSYNSRLNDETNEEILSDILLRELEQKLSSKGFSMPHKSFLINLMKVSLIKGFSITMDNGHVIPLAQKRAKLFKRDYAGFLANLYNEI